MHPDIYEPFARLGLNHVCSADHVGDEENDNYIEVQITRPGNRNPFRYSSKTPDSEKMLDPKNNITYINITGTTAQFLLLSNVKSSSNSSCNFRETITFLLDLNMEFDNGTIKCVLKDNQEEFSSVESRIAVIPGKKCYISWKTLDKMNERIEVYKWFFNSLSNVFFKGNYCEGYNDQAYRKHPSGDCNDYVDCNLIDGKMYAVGNNCPAGQCFRFDLSYCVPCDSSFTCEELTTPGKPK